MNVRINAFPINAFPIDAIRAFIAEPTVENLDKIDWDCWDTMCDTCPLQGFFDHCFSLVVVNALFPMGKLVKDGRHSLATILLILIQAQAKFEQSVKVK